MAWNVAGVAWEDFYTPERGDPVDFKVVPDSLARNEEKPDGKCS